MSRVHLGCILLVYTCLAAREPPMVTIPGQGTIQGKEISRYRSQKIIGFFGIPYAVPPLNNLRFAPPDTDNLEQWEGVQNATEYKPACLQTEKDIREEAKPFLDLIFPSFSEMEMNEDCLYLNVFVPFGKKNLYLNTISSLSWKTRVSLKYYLSFTHLFCHFMLFSNS